MVGSLLERHAHDTATFSEFVGKVASEQMGEILDRHLALEGHAATAGSVRARTPGWSHRIRAAGVLHGSVYCLRVRFAHFNIHGDSSDRIYYRTWFTGDSAEILGVEGCQPGRCWLPTIS